MPERISVRRAAADLEAKVELIRRASHRWSRSSKLPSPTLTAVQCHHGLGEPVVAHRNLVDIDPDGVSERAKGVLAKAEAMSLADYRAALVEREAAQRLTPGSPRSPMRRSRWRARGRRRSGPTRPPTRARPATR